MTSYHPKQILRYAQDDRLARSREERKDFFLPDHLASGAPALSRAPFESTHNSRTPGDHVTDSRSSIAALSDQLADAVAVAGAAVVAVHARPRLPSTGVHWKDGVVVTTEGTVRQEEDIAVTLPDGTRIPATFAGRDRGTDLAVLRVPPGSRAVAQLLERGYVPRGWIGAAMQPVRTDEGGGLLLVSIEKDTPAAQAGLLLGDVIVTIDGRSLESFDQLLDVLSDDSVGRKVSLDVVRAGKQRKLDLLIGERPRRGGR